MQLVRTTIRLDPERKKRAQKLALEQNKSFQEIVTEALDNYLDKEATKKTEELFVPDFDLGEDLNKLTRDEIYEKPDLSRY